MPSASLSVVSTTPRSHFPPSPWPDSWPSPAFLVARHCSSATPDLRNSAHGSELCGGPRGWGVRGCTRPVERSCLAALVYVVAGLEVLQVILQELLAELKHLHDPFVGHGVKSVTALATHLYVTAP